jgi:hypothetical protein
MITVGYPFDRSLSAVDLAGHGFQDVVIPFLGMRNDAAGTVLNAVPENECAIAFEQIERTPAEEA